MKICEKCAEKRGIKFEEKKLRFDYCDECKSPDGKRNWDLVGKIKEEKTLGMNDEYLEQFYNNEWW